MSEQTPRCKVHDIEMVPTKVAPCFSESVKDDIDAVPSWLCPKCWEMISGQIDEPLEV